MPTKSTPTKKVVEEPVIEPEYFEEPVIEQEETVTFQRSHFYSILTIFGFAAGVLLGYVVWGFDPDAISPVVAAQAAGPVVEAPVSSSDREARNWGGTVGPVLSDLLLQLFGIGALALPVLCLLLAYWTFRGEGILGKWSRAAGGLLAVCSTLGILSFFAGHVSVLGQDVFLPGVVGDLLWKHFLGKLLSTVGGVLALVALLLFSLMLVTGIPLSGLPGLVRREKSPEKVRAMVKERLAPRESWEEEAETPPPREPAPPRIVPPRPAAEEASPPRPAGKALVSAGYLFGNIPWVKQNLTLVILGIIAVSLLPGAIGYLRHRRNNSPFSR